VGAGASLAAGAPSTSALLDTVLDSLPTERVTIVGNQSTTQPLPLAANVRQALATGFGPEVDFELVMASLEELLSYGLGNGTVIRSFTEPRATFAPLLDTPMLFSAYSSAVKALIDVFLKKIPISQEQIAAHQALCSLFGRLTGRSRLVVATLNYDTLLDDASTWFNGFVGPPELYREFDPLAWRARVNARDCHLMIHLHGSLRFGLRPTTALSGNAPFNEPVLYPTESLAAQTIGRGVSNPTVDGHLLPATPIIVGGHKSPKLMHNPRPYAYYNATALDEIVTSDRLLIIGYGFRDQHVNAWIDEHLRLHPGGRIGIVTRRTGRDIGENTAVERFLMKLGQGDANRDYIYEPVGGAAQPLAIHGNIGRAYLVATGVPMAQDVETALLAYLLN